LTQSIPLSLWKSTDAYFPTCVSPPQKALAENPPNSLVSKTVLPSSQEYGRKIAWKMMASRLSTLEYFAVNSGMDLSRLGRFAESDFAGETPRGCVKGGNNGEESEPASILSEVFWQSFDLKLDISVV
jgi:hypothetical protein